MTAVLRVELFGDFSLTFGDLRVTSVATPRLQSLFAYLVFHRDAPQSRQHLAFLFWPDTHEAQARNNLRQLVHQLRRAMPEIDQVLQSDTSTIQWVQGTDITLDVAEFEDELLLASVAEQEGDQRALQVALERADRLYRADLLPSCYDEWIVPERDRLHAYHLQVIERLADLVEAQGDIVAAIRYAKRLVRADPVGEAGYRRLMHLLALHGDRAGALQVYQRYAAALQRELGVDPDPVTRAAYERLMHREEVVTPPVVDHAPTCSRKQGLIGRQREWDGLDAAWGRAVAGAPQFVLITGEAGVGKSRLAEDFLAWASGQGVVTAKARSYAAEGQLSLAPVTEWLRSDGLRPHIARLDAVWLAEVARILPELAAGRALVAQDETPPEFGQRQRFFEALARAIFAAPQPLALLIDDLQWCDQETLAWLHYLLRFDPAARLLVIGTVRAEELPQQQPLRTLLLHLRATTDVTEFNLEPLDAAETAKLAAQLAGIPTPMPISTVMRLFHETGGYPLFVVETMRAGLGRVSPGVPEMATDAAQRLAPRVHAVIEGRLLQLSPRARAFAELAAAIGREFTLDLLIAANGTEANDAAEALDELWHKRIVREHGANGYDFAHDTLREVAYAEVGPPQRQMLHRRIALALETRHAQDLDPVRGQIAAHLERAGLPERAIPHYRAAALVAQRVYATDDAIAMLIRSLSLLDQLPNSTRRDAQELDVQLALAALYRVAQGWTAPDLERALDRALALCDRIGDDARRVQLLYGLQSLSVVQAKLERVGQIAGEIAALHPQQEGCAPPLSAMMTVGAQLHLGRPTAAQDAFARMLAAHDPRQNRQVLESQGWHSEVHARAWQAHALWCLGYADAARDGATAALQQARVAGQHFNETLAAVYLATLQQLSADDGMACEAAETALALANEHRAPYYRAWSTILVRRALAWARPDEEHIAHLRAAIADFRATGARLRMPYFLALLAQVCGKAGRGEEGLAVISEAMAEADAHDEHWWDAELHRLRGELLRALGADAGEVEVAFCRAIEIARTQEARALELRAATSLAQLRIAQGRPGDANAALQPLFGWFTEGFETPDLQAAGALLAQLA